MNLDIRICLEFSAWYLELQLEIAEPVPSEMRNPAPRNDKKERCVSLIM